MHVKFMSGNTNTINYLEQIENITLKSIEMNHIEKSHVKIL